MELDLLTGLALHTQLHAKLVALAQSTCASRSSVSLLLVDVDRMKDLNATRGFDQGDRFLQVIAAILQLKFRDAGLIARIGGDEFVILLPGTQLDEACERAERLRLAVYTETSAFGNQTVTVSIGVATTPKDAQWLASDLLDQADLRLVVAKKRLFKARNRIWSGALPSVWNKSQERYHSWPTTHHQPEL